MDTTWIIQLALQIINALNVYQKYKAAFTVMPQITV